MSLFVNLTKSLAAFIAKSLTPATSAISADGVHVGSGFWRWRNNCERFCKRRERQKSSCTKHVIRSTEPLESSQDFSPSIKHRRSCLKLRFDKKGLSTASLLSGLRIARFSLNKSHHHAAMASTIPLQHQSVRTACGRDNCKDPCYWPPCPPNNERFIKEKNKLFNIYEAYWEDKNEDCCEDPCKWSLPRFDDIYLEESDKAQRTYTRTWYECPEKIVPKRVCCFDQGAPPDFCKRPKKERPATACRPHPVCHIGPTKCPKLRDSCCVDVRTALTCKPLTRGLAACKKFCTPYPSFSECVKPKQKAKRRVECKCLDTISMCEYWEYWRDKYANRTKGCF